MSDFARGRVRGGGGPGTGQHAIRQQRAARLCVEVMTTDEEFRTPREWIEVCDEVFTDLCRAFGIEPKRTLLGAVEEMGA